MENAGLTDVLLKSLYQSVLMYMHLNYHKMFFTQKLIKTSFMV